MRQFLKREFVIFRNFYYSFKRDELKLSWCWIYLSFGTTKIINFHKSRFHKIAYKMKLSKILYLHPLQKWWNNIFNWQRDINKIKSVIKLPKKFGTLFYLNLIILIWNNLDYSLYKLSSLFSLKKKTIFQFKNSNKSIFFSIILCFSNLKVS